MIVSLDEETRSFADLRKVGSYKYAEHPTTEVLCIGYAFGDDDPLLWRPGLPDPTALLDHIENGGEIAGWNVGGFDVPVWNAVLARRLGWPRIRWEQVDDTMARAAMMHLPQALGNCARALGLPEDKQKDQRGKQLIKALCKPHKSRKTGELSYKQDPALLSELYDYCKQDVAVERALAKRLRALPPRERRFWAVTQRINERGVPVAVDEAKNILRIVDEEKKRLDRIARSISGGAFTGVSKRKQVKAWLADQGLLASADESMDKEATTALLARDDVLDEERRVIEIYAAANQTSVSKIKTMLEMVCEDGTVKGNIVYHGASTGRDASRGINLQNVVRPRIDDIEAAHAVLGEGDWTWANAMWGDELMDAAVACVRGVLKAPPGQRFLDADYSSVENRIGVWISDHHAKIEMFRRGLDEYKVFAGGSLYRIPYDEVTKQQRQVSKSAVLGCFGPDTLLLTPRGGVRIVDLQHDDLLWDGVEWVRHEGVVYQGYKEVVELLGTICTPDHLFLTSHGWFQAHQLLQDASILRSARAYGAGRYWGSLLNQETKADSDCITSVDANAANTAKSRQPTLKAAEAKDASGADKKGVTKRTLLTRLRWGFLKNISTGWRIGSTRSKRVVSAAAGRIQGTPVEVLSVALAMRMRSSITAALSQDGIRHVWKLIAQTMTAITRWAICDSSHALRTSRTEKTQTLSSIEAARTTSSSFTASFAHDTVTPTRLEERPEKDCQRSKSLTIRASAKAHTFDVLNSGPRSRFTVLTDDGPLIAHNCMFGQGAKGLIEYAKGYGVELTLERSQEIVDAYREDYKPIQRMWYACGDAALSAVREPGVVFSAGKYLKFVRKNRYLLMRLPSGRILYWFEPRVEESITPWGEWRPAVTAMSVDSFTKRWTRIHIIGSSFYQSAVQGTAADVMREGCMALEENGYPLRLRVHDEFLSLLPYGVGSLQEITRILEVTPEWAPGLPIAASGWEGTRFRKD